MASQHWVSHDRGGGAWSFGGGAWLSQQSTSSEHCVLPIYYRGGAGEVTTFCSNLAEWRRRRLSAALSGNILFPLKFDVFLQLTVINCN